MSKVYIGIDPGSKGFVSVRSDDGFEFFPLLNCEYSDLYAFFEKKVECYGRDNIFVCMEDVHAIYGSSAEATFNFGWIVGLLHGMILGLKIPYSLVQPKVWQTEIWENADRVENKKAIICKNGKEMVRTEVDTKKTSYNAAKRLFPGMDFRRSVRCRDFDDNKVDSVLICEYARRRNF